jgi:hypothetical protein
MNMRLGFAAAAACLLLGNGAMASPVYIVLGNHCDFFQNVVVNGSTSLAIHNLTANCHVAHNAVAVGTVGQLSDHTGTWLVFADNAVDAYQDGYTGFQDYYAFQLPLKTGNSWFMYQTESGLRTTASASGTYTISATPPVAAKGPASWQDRNTLQPPR